MEIEVDVAVTLVAVKAIRGSTVLSAEVPATAMSDPIGARFLSPHHHGTGDPQVAQERLERLLDNYNNVPRVLRGFITGKLLPDFERLALFMRDGLVSKTTNPVENYYRQTDPESTKKLQDESRRTLLSRTENGVLDGEIRAATSTSNMLTATVMEK